MKNTRILLFFFLVIGGQTSAQNYPESYFALPVDPPYIITGTFGEIRDNHFHSGLDLRTGEEEEGVPIMAAADGYVSRIKIAADGYGKALYITHPNGYVTVYGHLQKYTAALNEYVSKFQNERKLYELDENPAPNQFLFKKGETIGYSGSTGSATNPHLHFEIRDEKSEETINPLLFGFNIKDTVAPTIQHVKIYPGRKKGILEDTDTALTYEVTNDNGRYKLNVENPPIVYGEIAFGIEAIDNQVREEENGQADLGIYAAELYVDGKFSYSWKLDRFSFDNTRDINAHIDFASYTKEGMYIQRCHSLHGSELKFYGDPEQTGIFNFTDGASHEIKIVVKDFRKNMAQIEFKVRSTLSLRETEYLPVPDNVTPLPRAKGLILRNPRLEVIIPENAVYDDCFYQSGTRMELDYLSDMFQVGDFGDALQKSITIKIKTKHVSDSLKSKVIMLYSDYYENLSPVMGKWEDPFFTVETKRFGNYVVALDLLPPKVESYYTPADMNNMYGGKVMLKVKDDMSGLKSYSGKIDGYWYLFEYDKKNDMLIANIDPFLGNIEHTIEMSVTDKVGNSTVWNGKFYY